jgi:glycosyltransferase involved in cell wall biosynthesis
MADPSISVVFPIYNEEAILEQGLRTLAGFLEGSGLSTFEVLVIESGSTDGSARIADRLAEQLSRVRVIHEGRRNGFGAAIQLGYRAAKMDWIWLMTPDLPFAPETLYAALALPLDQYDAVLSYRMNESRHPLRRVQSLVFNQSVKLLFGLRVRSVNGAFKLIRRRLVEDVEFHSRGWTFDTELVWTLQKLGARVAEVPISLIERTGGSSKIGLTTPFLVAGELVRLRLGPCRRRGQSRHPERKM